MSPSIPQPLYPPLSPSAAGMLSVSSRHTLHWEESGNAKGTPVLFLHGGPGHGSSPEARRFFDPSFYRIIQFDQRGSGKSMPYAEIRENTTPHLIQDIETLREHLKVSQWLVFGGSWGGTLGLAYASAHHNYCSGLILRSILLGERWEAEWFIQGSRYFFPQAWKQMRDHLSIHVAHAPDLLNSYYKLLIDKDPKTHLPAAQALCQYDGTMASLHDSRWNIQANTDPQVVLALARISLHYWVNDFFLKPGFILENASVLRHIPTTIIHGQYDMIAPPMSSFKLSQALPHARYVVVPHAGHTARDPGMAHAILQATELFKQKKPASL
jgi:proline iminopeptidase